jgi:Cu-Zn family superoxide dismutase
MNKLLAAILVSSLAACATQGQGPSASAVLTPTKGNTTSGTVAFSQIGAKVRVNANISGLKPNAEHGFHIHDKGDCSSGDGMSAGGHFNPTAQAHGAHASKAHHAGDLPSIKADANGRAKLFFESTSITGWHGCEQHHRSRFDCSPRSR